MQTPITFDDVARARAALAEHLAPSPVRHYAMLDALVGHGVRVLVKHDNHLPVNTFKVRNATAALCLMEDVRRRRGVIAASTGNHGQGLAWAGARLGVPVTICVPVGNNPEKNASIVALGARLVEKGDSYDDCVAECARIADAEGLELVHSTNHAGVLAGAATLSAEFLEQEPGLDAMVMALGGGSQAAGAIVARDATRPALQVFAAQSERARAQHDAWHDGHRRANEPARTFAEGIACGSTYDFTFETLRDGLADFVLVPDVQIAQSIRDLFRITHNVAEGAGATGLAGLRALAPRLAGRTVGIVVSGGNLDTATLRRVLNDEL